MPKCNHIHRHLFGHKHFTALCCICVLRPSYTITSQPGVFKVKILFRCSVFSQWYMFWNTLYAPIQWEWKTNTSPVKKNPSEQWCMATLQCSQQELRREAHFTPLGQISESSLSKYWALLSYNSHTQDSSCINILQYHIWSARHLMQHNMNKTHNMNQLTWWCSSDFSSSGQNVYHFSLCYIRDHVVAVRMVRLESMFGLFNVSRVRAHVTCCRSVRVGSVSQSSKK